MIYVLYGSGVAFGAGRAVRKDENKMPTFDTISEWVLENLYLVGAVTALVLLVVLIVLLAAARRRRRPARDKGADFFEHSSSLGDMDLVTPLGAEVPAASAPSASRSSIACRASSTWPTRRRSRWAPTSRCG